MGRIVDGIDQAPPFSASVTHRDGIEGQQIRDGLVVEERIKWNGAAFAEGFDGVGEKKEKGQIGAGRLVLITENFLGSLFAN